MRRIIQRSFSITSSEKTFTRFIVAAVLILGCGMLCPVLASAQQVTVGTATGAAGATVALTVTFTAGGAPGVSTLQFDLQLPAALSFSSVATGTAATAAGKSASGNAIAGGVRVLVFGLNQTTIGTGAVAVVSLSIAGGTPPGTLSVGITNITASDPTGTINVPTTGTGGSVTVSVSPDGIPPSIPTGLTAAAVSSSQINLAWTASTDNVGVTGYKIFRNGTQIATSTATSFQNTGLAASTSFSYKVSAFDAAGNNSGQSAAASATTQASTDTTAPSTPTNLQATAVSSSQINLSWSASTDNVAVTGYKIFRNGTQITTSTTTSFQNTGLAASTTFSYTVSAFDAAGNNSPVSAAASATTQAGTGPTPLTISSVATASVTPTSATLDWTTNAPSSSQVEFGATTAYGSSTPVDASPVTAHSETVINLTPNTLYHYRVHSQDSSGNQAVSTDFTFTTATETGSSQTCSTGIGLCFEATLPTAGGLSRVSSGQGNLSVLYGALNASAVSQPVALANFGLTQDGVLVTEVGIPASAPFTSTRLFVDYGGPGSDSGVALVNPNDTPIMVNAELRNPRGEFVSSSSITLEAKGHTAQFVSQLIANMPNPFLGTLTLSNASPFAAVNLRLASNAHGETLFSALPLADLSRASGATRLIFPQVVDGGGLPTQILLMNPSVNTTSMGFISFFDDDGNALALDFGPAIGVQSLLNYSLGPNGMVKYSTTGLGALRVGYAVVTPLSGFAPVGSGIFSINGNAGLASQAGVPNAVETTSSRLFVERATNPLPRDTGMAIVNRNGVEAQLTLTLVGVDGSTQSGTLTVPPNGHVAKFITELFPGLPAQYQGVMTMTSPVPVAAMTLRQTANQRGDLIYSTLPVTDLAHPPSGPLYIPQIADGGGYQTQLILINTSNSLGTVEIDFFDDHGVAQSSPLR
ncbi:MAG: fibronectin type III domain-containing protein [Acidobacteriia bacterium]|nr:fibronectin type III domain-containing protein [Terriglobia bacterium]